MTGPEADSARTSRAVVSCLGLAWLALASSSCSRGHPVCKGDGLDVVRPEGWTVETHCSEAAPERARICDRTRVHTIDLVMSKEDYEASIQDLDGLISGFTGGDLDQLATPDWYPVTVKYDGETWTKVAKRYKGHASLRGAFLNGLLKLSFLLDFDRLAGDDPAVKDQRFFGFRRLALSSAYNDPSHLRDTLGAEIFRASGVHASCTGFAAIYLDWGEGRTYLGEYTVIEDAADSMLAAEFGDASGNLYKPWGDAARWLSPEAMQAAAAAEGSSLTKYLAKYFEQSTNEGLDDFADVLAAVGALHDPRRTSDPAAWRANLEARFDVPAFLLALATNQAMGNWDSYGCKPHNYFLYGDPTQGGRLVYVPWDLNESLARHESCANAGSVTLDQIGAEWPLVQYVLADAVYRAEYCKDLQVVLDKALVVDTLTATISGYHSLIAPYVSGPEATEVYPNIACLSCKPEVFDVSLTTSSDALIPYLAERRAAVEAVLAAGCQ
ncbi:MAG: CotH kinase family protein [Myxococcales bacterium]